MVPIAADHAANIIDGDQLPRFVANVLPAGNFFQNQKADFVAGIKKMTRLRIMRRADDVALELATQNLRVAALNAAGHRLSGEGKSLMTIETSQLDDLAVELEAVVGELGLAETETA
jgi:hypothetical protein